MTGVLYHNRFTAAEGRLAALDDFLGDDFLMIAVEKKDTAIDAG